MPAQDGWTKTFTNPRLCAAIVDRLTFRGNFIETGIESYRLAQTKAKTAHRRLSPPPVLRPAPPASAAGP